MAPIFGDNYFCFSVGQALHGLLGLPCVLHITNFVGFVDPLKGMHTETIHLAIVGGHSQVGINEGQHLRRFRNVAEEIEEAIRILFVGDRGRFQRMNHVGKLNGIADKEYRKVVADKIIVAFVGIEFGGKAAWVAGNFRGTAAVHHC